MAHTIGKHHTNKSTKLPAKLYEIANRSQRRQVRNMNNYDNRYHIYRDVNNGKM